MKIDMHYTKPHKFIRGPLVGLCSLLSLSLIGCDGGLIGTGSGPDESVYELENLPERISPDVPKTLFRGEELPPPDNLNEKNKEVSALRRSEDEGSDKSEGWQAFTGDISTWSSLRLGIEINATIVDLAFDDIVNECADNHNARCR